MCHDAAMLERASRKSDRTVNETTAKRLRLKREKIVAIPAMIDMIDRVEEIMIMMIHPAF